MAREYTLPAGKLRHRITIQAEVNTRDSIGGVTKTHTDLATRWGGVAPLSGRELMVAQQTASMVTHMITMRAYAGLNANNRLVYDGRYFNIVSVRDIDERGKVMIIMAEERVTP